MWAWVKEGSRVAELKDVVRNLIWPWAEMPMVAAMTACSAGQSNNFRYKPIDFRVERVGAVG